MGSRRSLRVGRRGRLPSAAPAIHPRAEDVVPSIPDVVGNVVTPSVPPLPQHYLLGAASSHSGDMPATQQAAREMTSTGAAAANVASQQAAPPSTDIFTLPEQLPLSFSDRDAPT